MRSNYRRYFPANFADISKLRSCSKPSSNEEVRIHPLSTQNSGWHGMIFRRNRSRFFTFCAAVLDTIFYYWDALRGGSDKVPNVRHFELRNVFGQNTPDGASAVDPPTPGTLSSSIMERLSSARLVPIWRESSFATCASTAQEYQQWLRRPLYHEIDQVTINVRNVALGQRPGRSIAASVDGRRPKKFHDHPTARQSIVKAISLLAENHIGYVILFLKEKLRQRRIRRRIRPKSFHHRYTIRKPSYL